MTQAISSLDRTAVEALSSAAGEPGWLLEERLAAFAAFEREPAPTERTEGWRRLSLSGFDLSPAAPSPSPVSIAVSDADRKRGVIALPLSEALKTHEDLLREILCSRATEGRPLAELRSPGYKEDVARIEAAARPDGRVHQSVYGRPLRKFSALAESLWAGGAFVYVAAGTEVAEPIRIDVEGGPYPRVVIIIGSGAKASICETHRGSGRIETAVSDLILQDGARATYAHVQDCSPETVAFSHQRAHVKRDTKLLTLNFGIGARFSKNDVEVNLEGVGAESEMLGLVFAGGRQQFDYHTLQGHRSPHTRSDLLFKSALDGQSHSLYTGVIIIDRGAQRSDAYQANRNLLLSESARADTEPKLEIEADDVRCTHGATVGPIDEEQIFYLGSRGLDEETAGHVIVEGFFEEVFARVRDERLTKPLAAKIAPHLERRAASQSA